MGGAGHRRRRAQFAARTATGICQPFWALAAHVRLGLGVGQVSDCQLFRRARASGFSDRVESKKKTVGDDSCTRCHTLGQTRAASVSLGTGSRHLGGGVKQRKNHRLSPSQDVLCATGLIAAQTQTAAPRTFCPKSRACRPGDLVGACGPRGICRLSWDGSHHGNWCFTGTRVSVVGIMPKNSSCTCCREHWSAQQIWHEEGSTG